MNQIELLSPVGDFECLKAAVQSGADCVYFGGSLFNARASANNFNDEELKKAIEYAKIRNVKTNLTLNILIKNEEFSDAITLARKAYEYGIDAIIVQDLGLAKKLIELFPDLPIHASTQMTIHNLDGVLEAEKLGFKRVVLSRELSLDEIKYICDNSNIEIEVFVHGALCICYSGQCLLSSMIGGRSGNRGKCAQPCRLPYELIQTSHNGYSVESTNSEAIEKSIDKGYLLSPRDLCSLDLLPTLVNLGIKCFKIEGRLKNPEYVSTVTRIYRKYIDLAQSGKPYIIDENDKKDLLQVFNRGGFSTGYLNTQPSSRLIYKSKPNNMGIFLGTVSNFNSNKGYITLKLQDGLSIGDTVSLEKEKGSYNISELMVHNVNTPRANKGDIVKIGRIKGNISTNDKIYKMSSKELTILANEYINNEKVKVKINCDLTVHRNEPITMRIYTNNLNNIDFTIVSELIPVDSINSPITKERLIEQINKLGNTPFEFDNININLDNNLYVPSISKLNQLRRDCIEKLEKSLISKIHRTSNFNVDDIAYLNNTKLTYKNISHKNISILLNILNTEFDYTKLNNINKIYIPLKFFFDNKFHTIITNISHNLNTYIYMPSIMKDSIAKRVSQNLDEILSKYQIKGFVVSNISQIHLLQKYNSN